jgi:hypothetical protein
LDPQEGRPPLPSPPSLTAMSARKSGAFHWNRKETPCVRFKLECVTGGAIAWRALIGANMDLTTLLIIVVVVLLLGGGGWYGRGRWY